MKIDLRDALDEDNFYKKNYRSKDDEIYKKSGKNFGSKKPNKNKQHSKFMSDDDKDYY